MEWTQTRPDAWRSTDDEFEALLDAQGVWWLYFRDDEDGNFHRHLDFGSLGEAMEAALKMGPR